MPAVIRFLGYDPFPEPVTLSDRMRAYRKRNGLSIRAAALRAGVDEESSWWCSAVCGFTTPFVLLSAGRQTHLRAISRLRGGGLERAGWDAEECEYLALQVSQR